MKNQLAVSFNVILRVILYIHKLSLRINTACELLYLRNVIEVPRGTPIAALYLELGILAIQFETEKRQLLFLRPILNKDFDDPAQFVYNEQLKYEFEKNWEKLYVRTATYI